MEKKNYKHPEMFEFTLNPKEDILTGSGYTKYELFGTDGVGDISDVDKVFWGQ